MLYKFTGDHPAAAVATLAGDGPRKLKGWRDAASFEPPADGVLMCDRPGLCRVRLALPDAALDDPAHWVGGTFSLSGRSLAIEVEAESAEEAYESLVKGLFSRFPGQPETGRATFPVCVGAEHLAQAMLYDHAEDARVRVRQIPCPLSLPARFAAAFGDVAGLEYLTVSVPAAAGAAGNWEAL